MFCFNLYCSTCFDNLNHHWVWLSSLWNKKSIRVETASFTSSYLLPTAVTGRYQTAKTGHWCSRLIFWMDLAMAPSQRMEHLWVLSWNYQKELQMAAAVWFERGRGPGGCWQETPSQTPTWDKLLPEERTEKPQETPQGQQPWGTHPKWGKLWTWKKSLGLSLLVAFTYCTCFARRVLSPSGNRILSVF